MPEALNRISFDEFSDNLARIFDRVISEGEEIVVEKGEGELVSLKPASRAKPVTSLVNSPNSSVSSSCTFATTKVALL
ncbi:hypothetical protein LCGC14_1474100, partial [marine sediment metagenome]